MSPRVESKAALSQFLNSSIVLKLRKMPGSCTRSDVEGFDVLQSEQVSTLARV